MVHRPPLFPLAGGAEVGCRPRPSSGSALRRPTLAAEGSGDREVEFPVLRTDQEAFPLVPVEDVRRLGPVF